MTADLRKREWGFLFLVLAIGVFLLLKTVRFSLDDGKIAMTITKNRGGVSTLDIPRKPESVQKLPVREIDFPQGRMLESPQYGKLGYTTNFFLDFRVDAEVKKAGLYRFEIRSDDGFRLKIDGRTVCQHPGNRPMSVTACDVRLRPGRIRLDLSYFQGGGPLGLEARVRAPGGKKSFFIGEDTDHIVYRKSQ